MHDVERSDVSRGSRNDGLRQGTGCHCTVSIGVVDGEGEGSADNGSGGDGYRADQSSSIDGDRGVDGIAGSPGRQIAGGRESAIGNRRSGVDRREARSDGKHGELLDSEMFNGFGFDFTTNFLQLVKDAFEHFEDLTLLKCHGMSSKGFYMISDSGDEQKWTKSKKARK